MLVTVYFSYCDVDHYSSIFNLKTNVKEKQPRIILSKQCRVNVCERLLFNIVQLVFNTKVTLSSVMNQ